jgi:hypothetical protein
MKEQLGDLDRVEQVVKVRAAFPELERWLVKVAVQGWSHDIITFHFLFHRSLVLSIPPTISKVNIWSWMDVRISLWRSLESQ